MKNILITGASSGLGKKIAEDLHHKGYNVIGTSRNPNKHTTKYPLYSLNINEDQDVSNVIKKFIEQNGKIDVLINNAGYGIAGPIEDTSIEEAKSQFDTNFFGLVRMTKAILPAMRSQKGGIIINMGSIGGLIGVPFQGFYSASKFAIEGYTEALRVEVKPFNINVFNINPGDFSTSFTKNRRVINEVTDPYKEKFEAALEVVEKDERNGSDPQIVAELIEKLIKKNHSYRVRYLVGAKEQKLAVTMKKILGSKTFENLIIKNFNQK